MKRLLCPLKKNYSFTNNGGWSTELTKSSNIKVSFGKCDQEECAWWDENNHTCSQNMS